MTSRTMESLRTRVQTVALAWLDVLAYAITVTVLATVLAVSVGIATGGGFVRGKELLFVAGWLSLGYATIRMWPSAAKDARLPDDLSVPRDGERTRIQALSRALPPIRWIQLPPPEKRVTIKGKFFVASVVTLLASFLMETWVGIS